MAGTVEHPKPKIRDSQKRASAKYYKKNKEKYKQAARKRYQKVKAAREEAKRVAEAEGRCLKCGCQVEFQKKDLCGAQKKIPEVP